ncbi:MAG: hypothetical protein ABIQ18_32010 [Umezawaea sp.]
MEAPHHSFRHGERVYSKITQIAGTIDLHDGVTTVLWDHEDLEFTIDQDDLDFLGHLAVDPVTPLSEHPAVVAGLTLHGFGHGQRVLDTVHGLNATVYLDDPETSASPTGHLLYDQTLNVVESVPLDAETAAHLRASTATA